MSKIIKNVELNNLASDSVGARILFATDDFFAPAELMLSDTEPEFDPNAYTEFGKLMDGWETRRKRMPGHDFCIIKLGASTVIKQVLVDTAHFTGNYVPRISVQAGNFSEEFERQFPPRSGQMGTGYSQGECDRIEQLTDKNMVLIVPMSRLEPGVEATRKSYFPVNEESRETSFTHIRLNVYPDGGLARFKVFGTVSTNFDLGQREIIDLMSVLNGCVCVAYSNAHFGHPSNLMKPKKSLGMHDGWETARRIDRPPILEMEGKFLKVYGYEFATFKFGGKAMIQEIIIDTTHFKGNYPERLHIDGCYVKENESLEKAAWKFIAKDHLLSADKEHVIRQEMLLSNGPFNHIRYTIFPDGGIARIRVFGSIVE